MILKVPQSLQDKWNRKVLDTRRKHKREVDFSDIVKFLETETTLMSDPAYSRDALTEAGKLLKSNSTQLVEAEGGRRVSWGAICPLCAGTHDFEDCQDFLAKGIDDRHKTVFQLKLCFSCLGPIDDEHKGKSCTAKRKCKVCSEDHPTTLHGGKSMPARHTALPYKVISMCVVQVEVWHKDNADNRLTVYALLDECSQGTFIKDDILEKLNVSNLEHTTIRVGTAIGNKEDQAVAVKGLVVGCVPSHATVYGKAEVELPCTYSRPYLAVGVDEIPTPSSVRPWKHLQKVASKLPEYDPSIPIGLMIGSDCPRANEPHEVILSESGGPYAKRLKLGWSVIGPINKHIRDMVIKSNCTSVRRVESVQDVTTGAISDHVFTTSSKVEDTRLTRMLQEMYTSEFNEERSEKIGLSVEDERFLATMEAGIRKNGKHYELPLPFRTKELILPNNRSQALSRLSSLKRKLQANAEYKSVYDEFMKNLISCYHSRKADTSKDDIGKVWYVPHFGVINPKKEKLRVVFDFSARFQGRCLNEELIQGPNLANLMLGVILRFRREEVAYMADLEAMFYQVQVPDEQRSFLRFLYWPEGKLDEEPVDYEMCVHLFGAVSSGSCANFALKQTAYDGKERYGAEAANVLVREFYVDDHLHSKPDVDSAKVLFRATREMCASGGFNLTKFVSNSKELMEQIPSECLASSLVNIDLSKQHLPIERALGIGWCLEDDSLQYRITLQDKPLNRRGVLATISSVHDPSGLAGPFILPGRVILQKVTGEKGGWDDDLTPEHRAAWEKWRIELVSLQDLKIQRCYKPKGFKAVSCSLHSFADASDYGYGEATYLWQVSENNEVCVSLVMAKSRVVPAKQTTIPRMELVAALLAAKVTALVKEELDMVVSETYWVDSMIVLGYIQNDIKRFRTFVANRRRKVRHLTDKRQWKKIDTKDNPADYASRGISVKETTKVKKWFKGPGMLWELEDPSKKPGVEAEVPDDDPEVQVTIASNAVVLDEGKSVLHVLETRVSRWSRMKSIVAWCKLFVAKCRKESRNKCSLNTEDLVKGEVAILKMLQQRHFAKEVSMLDKGKELFITSKILKLSPILDEDGLLRVGGRLKKSLFNQAAKHPVILPKKEIIVQRIIEHHHREIEHLGRTSTLNELRSQGYWIINGVSQVDKVINPCVLCKGIRGQPESQRMADLPEERTAEEPPFTYCGSDFFGPYIIKEGRKELKRYGVIFTCFSCRAIHLETTTLLNTDSFILSLRRFIARRGPVRSIRSDNGGNYIGVEGELKKALEEMDKEKISAFLLKHSCDWIEWEKNPPSSSHMGGVWERQIRLVKNVLSSLLHSHAARLDDESLRTLFTEVEAIVNSRPLAVDTLTDETIEPITPNHLLTMKSKVVFPPPGNFQKADVYCRKRWRAVQFLANEFWRRWRHEYLQITQERKVSGVARRNMEVGDIVLLIEDDVPRNRWPMAKVVEVFPSSDGLVRKVSLKVSGSNAPLKRPVVKLILLVKASS